MAQPPEPGGRLHGRPVVLGLLETPRSVCLGGLGGRSLEGGGGVRLRGEGGFPHPSLTSLSRSPLWSPTRRNPGGKLAAAVGGSPGA